MSLNYFWSRLLYRAGNRFAGKIGKSQNAADLGIRGRASFEARLSARGFRVHASASRNRYLGGRKRALLRAPGSLAFAAGRNFGVVADNSDPRFSEDHCLYFANQIRERPLLDFSAVPQDRRERPLPILSQNSLSSGSAPSPEGAFCPKVSFSAAPRFPWLQLRVAAQHVFLLHRTRLRTRGQVNTGPHDSCFNPFPRANAPGKS